MNPKINLYVVQLPQEFPQNLFEKLLKCVDSTQLERILTCKNKSTAQSTLMGDIFVRYLAANLLHMKSVDFRYGYSINGKPYLMGCDTFQFNISHSGQYVAVSAGPFETGCDIQKYESNYHGMEQIVFNKAEQKLIQSDKDFYRLWTLKESFLKAIGTGFLDDPTKYTVSNKIGSTKILYHHNEYRFHEFDELNNYAVSVCANGEISNEINIISFEKIINTVLVNI